MDKANDYFYSVYSDALTDLSNISISEEDVCNDLTNLDLSKTMGPDGIPPVVLSKCASVLYKPFHYLFSFTLKYGYLPRDWKIHKIISVFKSGEPKS